MSMIIMMVAIFAIMYFFMIRPQNKKQKRNPEIQKQYRSGYRCGNGRRNLWKSERSE